MAWDATMNNQASRFAADLRDINNALRRNNKLPHSAILGVVAVIVLGSGSWFFVSLGIDAMAYIDQHGWQNAMERIDNFTVRLWKGPGK